MNQIYHKQAIKWIHRRLDGLLTKKQHSLLDEHLYSCDSCRAYAAEMDWLPAQLQNEFHARWDEKSGPSPKIMQYVTTKGRNIPMTNRISSGAKWLVGAIALITLGFAINFAVSQLRNTVAPAVGTEFTNNLPGAEDRLLAFTSRQNGNFDIYTIHANGNALINLTNDPAADTNPFWSPDGKRIAFESDRSGISQIYLMDADSSNVIQLTTGEAAHYLPMNIDGITYPWSPDGSKILILEDDPGEQVWTLISQNIKDGDKISLATGQLYYNGVSWSPDGNYIGYILDASPDSPPLDPDIHIADANGNNPRDLKKVVPHTERLDSRYRWSSDGGSIIFTTTRSDPPHATLATIVYEYEPSSDTLLQKDNLKEMGDWEDSQHLVTEFRSFESSGLISVRQYPDGKGNLLDVDTQCLELNIKRSPLGNLAIAAYCPDNQFRLYWANTGGSIIKQLLSLPVDATVGSPANIVWSPDDRYITFDVASSNQSNVYIVDTEKALADPSTQPVQVLSSEDTDYSMPSWQPVMNNKVAEEEPTPQPSPQAKSRLLAFASTQNGDSDIYTMHADGSELTNLTNDPAYDGSPFWSPDGKQLAFQSDRSGSTQIYLMDADGSNIIQLTNEDSNLQFDINGHTPWSPDGRRLIFSQFSNGERKSKLYSVDVDGTNKITLTNEPGEYVWPSWSPNGEYIAFISYESQERPIVPHLFVVDKNGNGLVELTGSLPMGESFSAGNYYWSRNGTSIFFMVNSNENQGPASMVYEANLDGSLNVITRASKPVLDWWNGTVLESETPLPALTWLHLDGSQATLDLCRSTDQALNMAYKRSYNGNLVFGANCSASGWILYWANPDGTVTSKLMDSLIPVRNDILFNIAWSPDDHFIAFVSLDSDSSNVTNTLYVLDVEQARNDPSVEPLKMEESYSPSWQPVIKDNIVEQKPTSTQTPLPSQQTDTGLIAFSAALENRDHDVYTMHADGNALMNVTNNPAMDINPFWSPDGRRIAFESDRDGFTHIFLMDADGSNVVQLTNGEAQHYFSNTNPWSPDGSKLLFAEWTPQQENWMLSVIGVDGLNKTLLTEVPNIYSNPSWSPDGQHVVLLADDPQNLGGNRLYVVDADGQNRRELTQSLQVNEQLSTLEYDWSPDGQSIFFISLLQTTDPSWTVYEARVADSSLITHVTTKTPLFDWRDDVSVVFPFIWKRSEETLSALDPYKNCQQTDAAQSGSYMKRSPNGAWLVSAYCPNGDLWLYWVRSDGTLNRQLLDVPIPSEQRTFSDLVWSPDEKFVAFNVFSNNLTDMYILDVEASLNDPSIKPLKITVSGGNLFSNMSWRPLP